MRRDNPGEGKALSALPFEPEWDWCLAGPNSLRADSDFVGRFGSYLLYFL
jgi:hypothetical protein